VRVLGEFPNKHSVFVVESRISKFGIGRRLPIQWGELKMKALKIMIASYSVLIRVWRVCAQHLGVKGSGDLVFNGSPRRDAFWTRSKSLWAMRELSKNNSHGWVSW